MALSSKPGLTARVFVNPFADNRPAQTHRQRGVEARAATPWLQTRGS